MSMRRLIAITASFCITLIGCRAFEAPGPALTGAWGGDALYLQASSSGASLAFPCSSGATGPLYVDGAGLVNSGGSYRTCALGSCRTSTLWLEGRQVADTLLATEFIGRRDSAHATLYRLQRNGGSNVFGVLCAQ